MSPWWDNALHATRFVGTCAGALMVLHQLERRVSRYLSHRLGWNSVLFTGWLGVPLHELSHLVAARFFGHRVVAYRLFDPDPVTGTLGYVRHAYSRRSAFQILGTFAIGIAPALAGTLALCLLLAWMVPLTVLTSVVDYAVQSKSSADALVVGGAIVDAVWAHRSAWLPLHLYLLLCVASHLSPSASDLKNGAAGAGLLMVMAGVLVALATWHHISLAGLAVTYVPILVVVCGVLVVQLTYVASVELLHRLGAI